MAHQPHRAATPASHSTDRGARGERAVSGPEMGSMGVTFTVTSSGAGSSGEMAGTPAMPPSMAAVSAGAGASAWV